MQSVCASDPPSPGMENKARCLGACPALSSNVGLGSKSGSLARVLALVI